MLTFLLRRLALAIPTLFGVLAVVFVLLYVAPGDPVQEMVGERADAATIARLRRELRLDQPLYVQFGHYAAGVVRELDGQRIVEAQRAALSRQADSLAFADAPMAYLFFYNELYAIQPWITGFQVPTIFNGQRWIDVKINPTGTR